VNKREGEFLFFQVSPVGFAGNAFSPDCNEQVVTNLEYNARFSPNVRMHSLIFLLP